MTKESEELEGEPMKEDGNMLFMEHAEKTEKENKKNQEIQQKIVNATNEKRMRAGQEPSKRGSKQR